MTSKSILLSAVNTQLNEGCEYRERLGLDADGRTLLYYRNRVAL